MQERFIVNEPSEVAVFSDFEGDLKYFEELLQSNPLVGLNAENRLYFKDPKAKFVFNGDLWDKGLGDIRLAKLLTEFKKENPDRVFFIMGNRDVNKMRLTTELPLDPRAALPEPSLLSASPFDICRFEQYLIDNKAENTPINRLKWILAKTMGSPTAFENRRKELALVADLSDEKLVSDQDVYLSFRLSVEDPAKAESFLQQNPALKSQVLERVYQQTEISFARSYLKECQLVLKIGTALYSHGAIRYPSHLSVPKELYGKLKDEPDYLYYESIEDWVEALNVWGKKAFELWVQEDSGEAYRGGFSDEVASSALHLYVTAACDAQGKPAPYGVEHSCISIPHMPEGDDRVPPKDRIFRYKPLSQKMVDYLNSQGINYLICGHQPHGSTPVLMHCAGTGENKVEVLCLDTTLSGMQDGEAMAFNRGKLGAGTNALFSFTANPKESSFTLEGLSGKGDKYTYHFSLSDEGENDPFIGKIFRDKEGHEWLIRVQSQPEALEEPAYFATAITKKPFTMTAKLISKMELKNQDEYGLVGPEEMPLSCEQGLSEPSFKKSSAGLQAFGLLGSAKSASSRLNLGMKKKEGEATEVEGSSPRQ